MRNLIVANWKMNGTRALLEQYKDVAQAAKCKQTDVVICLPFPFLALAQDMCIDPIGLAAQDCSDHTAGARTGEVSAPMLKDFGVSHCLVGHSERRQNHDEPNARLKAKLAQLRDTEITPIFCIGETEEQREANSWRDVLTAQLSILDPQIDPNVVVAYEPVWAIGTGRVPTSAEIDETLFFVRDELKSLGFVTGKQRFLYGGSVDEYNAARLISLLSVDGLLVGGASLNATRFAEIVGSGVDTNWARMRC